MTNKNGGMEKKVPTLLELSKHFNRRPPTPDLSSSSDDDQPPVAASQMRPKSKSALNLFRNYDMDLSPPPERRNLSKHLEHSKKMTETFSNKRKISSKTLYGSNYLQPSLSQTSGARSGTQSTVSGIRSSSSGVVLEKRIKMDEESPSIRSRNYHIKAIRKGVPEIISTDPRGRNKILVSTDVEITPNCVCSKNPKRRTDLRAWTFSFVTAFLCIICPLISLSADVTFFMMCSGHYDESREILQLVQERFGVPETPAPTSTPFRHSLDDHQKYIKSSHRHRKGRDIGHENGYQENAAKETTRHAAKRISLLPSENIFDEAKNTEPKQTSPLPEMTGMPSSILPDDIYYANDASLLLGRCQFPEPPGAICANQSQLRDYILTSKAETQLVAHHHVIKDVFEPIFILGSFPSLILCMFSRSVIMLTSHDHFLSAYIMNIIAMPLQLSTGALSFHSATYHLGPYGMECWKCALDENCSKAEANFWQKDNVIVSLITATAAKFLDGIAGGIVLVVVLGRLMWRREGHVSCWWYIARFILSLFVFVLCVTISTTMLLTPSFAVFQSELIETITHFDEKTSLCYSSLAVLSIGAISWGISLLVLFLYLTYRTYVYCRIKEHLSESVLL